MDDILDRINQLRGVGGSLFLNPEGLAIAARLRAGTDETTLSANLAEMVANAVRLAKSIGIGRPHLLHAHAGEGGLTVMAAGPGFLALILDPQANLTLLQLEIRPFLESIKKRTSL